MEREQIIKELEGLVKHLTCPEYIKNALSLIKKLTEENTEVKANWQKLKDSYDSNDAEWQEIYADSQSKWEKAYEKLEVENEKLRAENERLRNDSTRIG